MPKKKSEAAAEKALRAIQLAKPWCTGKHLEALHTAEGIIAVALNLRSSAWKRARAAATRALSKAAKKKGS